MPRLLVVFTRLLEILVTTLFMFALLEIARIYKALKRFPDLQGPICYSDAQNKEMNLIVY